MFLLLFLHHSMILSVLALAGPTCSPQGCPCPGMSPAGFVSELPVTSTRQSTASFRTSHPAASLPRPCQVWLISSFKSSFQEKNEGQIFCLLPLSDTKNFPLIQGKTEVTALNQISNLDFEKTEKLKK
uniref:Uncharacterized protein n=1 Tax=Falco tinnunculus TaxID=100819 RepID=A0A8C4VG97_FALTI